jgi:hypothetical protein
MDPVVDPFRDFQVTQKIVLYSMGSCSQALLQCRRRTGRSLPRCLEAAPDASTLEIFEAAGPVSWEEPAERPVGEDPAACLDAGAVAGLVVCADYALHRGTADRAGLAVPTVHGHVGVEGSHLLRKPVTCSPQ